MILESGLIKKMRRFKKVSKEKNAPSLLMIYEFENQEIFARYEECPELADAKRDTKERWGKRFRVRMADSI